MSSGQASGNFLLTTLRANPYGWRVVFVMFMAMSMVSVSRASIGLVMPALEQDMGWSRGFISTVVAWALISIAIVSPLVGNLLDRFGARRILLCGLLVTAGALALTSQVDSVWQILLAYSVLGGIGFGIVSKNIASATVARQFDANRGLAVGVANAGATAGHIAILPVMAMILTAFGWRYGYLFLAGICVALLPVVWLLLKPGPDPSPAPRHATAAGRPAALMEEEVPGTLTGRLKLLFRNRTFLALLGSYTICGFTATGMIDTHFLPYAVACGIPLVTGAAAYGVLATFNMGGMALSGYLSDRINRPRLLAVIYIMRGLSYIILLLVPVYDVNLIWVFAVVFGIFDYSTIPVTTSLVASHIGLRTIGLSLGVLAMFHAAGGALGAFLGGVLYDMFAKYDFVWVAAISVAMIAGILVLTIREDRDAPASPLPQPLAA
ncbi:MAG: MFS transporter [Alphaproteobacteria bacterium]|nr:MFS transporter [Alphaproteobacteria bacterium]